MQDGAFVEDALDKHGDTVLRLACSMLNDTEAARDMVQETFIKLLKSDVVFENDGHVRSWLITVTRNACCDVLRSQKRVTVELVDPTVTDALEKLMADRVQLSESAIAIDDGDYLWRHVAQLPLEQRTVVLLHYAEDLSIAEIADAMDKSRPCIRAQLSRARKSLRKMIDDERDQREEEEKHEMAARKRFKTYRKQARTLKLDDETRDRTLQVIHALEAERERNQACAATASAQAFPAPTTTKTAIPALKSHSRRKRPHALRTPLKAAACIVLTVGLATVAVAAPTVVETAMHTVPKVGANEPLRPYQRIEFTDASFSYLGAEQPYTVPQKYDPDEQCYGSAVVRLFLPGSLNEPLEVSVLGAQDVRVCGEDPYTARLDIPAEKTSISLTEENGYTFSLIRLVNITEKQFNDLFSDNGRAICTDDMLAELLDSLRNISISVKTSDSVRTYRLDFSDLPDVRSIRLALVHKEYRPIMATLVQESCSYDTL